MKKMFVLLILSFALFNFFSCCDFGKSPASPDPIDSVVTINGEYERVYPITNPESNARPQIVIWSDRYGGFVVNTKQLEENKYSFFYGVLKVNYPEGPYYEFSCDDDKVWKPDRTEAGRRITINGKTLTRVTVKETWEIVRCYIDKNGTVYEVD